MFIAMLVQDLTGNDALPSTCACRFEDTRLVSAQPRSGSSVRLMWLPIVNVCLTCSAQSLKASTKRVVTSRKGSHCPVELMSPSGAHTMQKHNTVDTERLATHNLTASSVPQ